jgi:hypothetical protein
MVRKKNNPVRALNELEKALKVSFFPVVEVTESRVCLNGVQKIAYFFQAKKGRKKNKRKTEKKLT